jgi:hypothetical protein
MADNWKRQVHALHSELVHRDNPAAWVSEADAVDASRRYPHIALRGPVFGIAVHDPAAGSGWRLLKSVVDGMPQQARDGLNSHLWFKAKDETDDPGVRRELLAAVTVLEQDPVNDLEVLGVRYRVVRGDEFARSGEDGLEPPRPTDVEPLDLSWDVQLKTPSPDADFGLDPHREDGLVAGAMRLSLRDFAYSGSRFPADVRADSERATAAHPEVVLLPVGFGVAERGERGWRPRGALMPTPHDARRMLYDAMAETCRAQGSRACLTNGDFGWVDSKTGEIKGNADSWLRGTPVPRWPGAWGDPLWTPPGMGRGLERAHLNANRLGGTGQDRRNLTPLYSDVNYPDMWNAVEKGVVNRLNKGDTMYYQVLPIYSGDSLVPSKLNYSWKDFTTGESDYGDIMNTP